MSMRYLTMAAVTAGFVLLLPGVVSASGKHLAKGSDHGQAAQHGNVNHAENVVKKTVNQHKKTISRKSEHAANKVKHQVHISDSVKHISQAAEHASKQAVDHAADQSAVHRSISRTSTSSQTDKQPIHKNESRVSSLHNQKQDSSKQVEKPIKSRQTIKTMTIKANPSKKETLQRPKASLRPSKGQIKQKTEQKPKHPSKKSRRKNNRPFPKDPSGPVAVLTPAATLMSLPDHSRHGKAPGSSRMNGGNFGILPPQHQNGAFSEGTLVSRLLHYRSQWINAPPSPPPRVPSSF